jgi:hypothetical protein
MRQESSVCRPQSLRSWFGPGFRQRLEHMRRLVGGDVKLPAELADIGDPVRAGEAHADLDLARGGERMASLERSSGLTACISDFARSAP